MAASSQTQLPPEETVSILVNPLPPVEIIEPAITVVGCTGPESPGGTDSPGASQMSPPPSYYDIPGTVRQGASRGPPPSYEDAVDPNAEPPSYDSLFGRIRDTHKSSRNLVDFIVRLLFLLLGTIGCTVVCGITIVIPLCMVVIGSLFFHDCPAEPYIPIFLIVGGSFSIIKYLIGVVKHTRTAEDSNEPTAMKSVQMLISCYLCGWFIIGCIWVYRAYKPNLDDETAEDYCNRTVYMFAFWLITATYIFLGFFTSCICCFSIVAVVLKKDY